MATRGRARFAGLDGAIVGGLLGLLVGVAICWRDGYTDALAITTVVPGSAALGGLLGGLLAALRRRPAPPDAVASRTALDGARRVLLAAQPADQYSTLVPTAGQRIDALDLTADWQRRHIPVAEIAAVFDQAGRQLVILGGPGSGKTAAAYRLADLLSRGARRSDTDPVPVVVELSRWAGWHETHPDGLFGDWLADEIAFTTQYQVPAHLVHQLIEDDRLVPILDGLDEIPDPDLRTSCLRALNRYLGGLQGARDATLRSFVLCSRYGEYRQVAARWRVPGDHHVTINPLTRGEISRFLTGFGDPSLAAAGATVRAPGHESLAAVLGTPLGLRILTDQPARDLPDITTQIFAAAPTDQIWNVLWAAYVTEQLRGLDRYPAAGARRCLHWLAAALTRQNEQMFWIHELYRYASPAQLHTGLRRITLSARLAGGLAGVLAGGLAGGLVGGPMPGPRGYLDPRPRLHKRFTIASVAHAAASHWVLNLVLGLVGVLALVLAGGLPLVLAGGLAGVLALVLAGVLALVLALVLATLISDVITEHSPPATRPAPNNPDDTGWALRLSARAGLVGGLAVGLAYGLVVGLAFGLVGGLAFGLDEGLDEGLAAVALNHELRRNLHKEEALPADLTGFLDACVESRLMRRSAGSYRFLHRELQEHLADEG